jgi:hypothetical protein
MISADELKRGQTMTTQQILRQVDVIRVMILESRGGGKQAYESIRAADPLRRPATKPLVHISSALPAD